MNRTDNKVKNMILFLDFDGVLHPRIGSSGFVTSCVHALRLALEPFAIEIVVSSTWRSTCHYDELIALLKDWASQ